VEECIVMITMFERGRKVSGSRGERENRIRKKWKTWQVEELIR